MEIFKKLIILPYFFLVSCGGDYYINEDHVFIVGSKRLRNEQCEYFIKNSHRAFGIVLDAPCNRFEVNDTIILNVKNGMGQKQ